MSTKKPRTYRKLARKRYLNVTRQKQLRAAARRKGIRAQLNYLSRNLSSIDQLIASGSKLSALRPATYQKLLAVSETYRQQQQMYQSCTYRIDDRIVSITQPWVRPVKRGKLTGNTEFGAKLSASKNQDYVFLDRLSRNN